MKKINYIFLFAVGLVIIFSAQKLYASEYARARYDAAIRYIKNKQPDFALMEFRSVIRDFPKSPLAQRSVFAIAEYCYDNKMYNDAIKDFTGYVKSYPSSKANVFAKAYLLKIIEEIANPALEEKDMLEDIKKEFFSTPLFLLFKEYKETSYKSPSRNKFKIRYYIDNIEVYRNGQLFIKVTQ
jgi:outer membrane protein assembly factor BamD (BamD/ComL family)